MKQGFSKDMKLVVWFVKVENPLKLCLLNAIVRDGPQLEVKFSNNAILLTIMGVITETFSGRSGKASVATTYLIQF